MNDLINRLRSGAVMPGDLDDAAEQMQAQTEANAALRAQLAALTAKLDAAKAGAVRVKPLVWEWSERVQGWRADCYLTRDVFITYETSGKWSAGSQMLTSTFHPSADAAKSHLDQMRAARILAALEPAPVSEAALIRAAEEIQRLRYVLEGVAGAIDTGRNEPLVIWREQINIALEATDDATIAAIRERAKG